MTTLPILWSFRRCPYAMRARLAVQSSGVQVALQEILLRDKPAAFLATSPKGTVPVINDAGTVIEESRDVMLWALRQNDPENLLDMPAEGFDLLDQCDGPFKAALDHTKYAVRHPDKSEAEEREKASIFLRDLNTRLANQPYLFGANRTIADIGIAPFVRQFANTDRAWFDAQDWPHLIRWLDRFLESADFAAVMTKYTPWQLGDALITFPQRITT